MIWNISFEIFSRLLAYTLTSMIELGESKLISCTTWIYSWCFCANDLCIRADWSIWLHKPAATLSDCSSFCSKLQHWPDLNLPAIAWTLWHDVESIYIYIYSWDNTELIWPLTTCSDHWQSSPLSSLQCSRFTLVSNLWPGGPNEAWVKLLAYYGETLVMIYNEWSHHVAKFYHLGVVYIVLFNMDERFLPVC